ncbi:hypothetical protein HDZ31DRAFT_81325 [Schizophyllum fasciatum]
MDATRLSDSTQVVIRRTQTWKDELPIYQRLAARPSDVRNRLAPILDVVLLPDTDEEILLVLPFLRVYYDPAFSRVDQVVQCVSQFLEVMRNAASEDFCSDNLMMDATNIVPGGHHFAEPYSRPDGRFGLNFRDRAEAPPVQYFVIDLGLADQMLKPDNLVTGIFGQDRTVPELSWDVPYDPFKVDIYQFGNVITRDMLNIYDGLDFLRPLAEMMTQPDPEARPSISEALAVFRKTVQDMPLSALQQNVRAKRHNGRIFFAPEARS